MFLHGQQRALNHEGVIDHAFDEVFEVSVNDGERGPQFMTGVSDKVFANLFGFALLGFVADEDAQA